MEIPAETFRQATHSALSLPHHHSDGGQSHLEHEAEQIRRKSIETVRLPPPPPAARTRGSPHLSGFVWQASSLQAARAELEHLKEMQLEKELADVKAAIASARGRLGR